MRRITWLADAAQNYFSETFYLGRGMSALEGGVGVSSGPQNLRVRWWNFGSNFAWTASLFLAGLGAKLGLIFKFGQSLPYLDQWPGEAIELIIPYFTGQSWLARLFYPHNEHWIVFTRLCDLVLLRLNGQWDSLLEMAVNAVIHCAGIAAFGWVMASLLGRKSWPLIWMVLVLDLALPFAWENTLWGFQSQFYFLIILAWLTLWLLALNEPWSPRWWLGALAALVADFNMAAGFLAGAAVIAVTLLGALKQRGRWRRLLPTWCYCAGIIVLGLALKMSLPTDHTTQARTAGEFLETLGKSLAWPWATHRWYAFFNFIPLLLLGWMRARSVEPLKPKELMIFGIGIWAGLQAVAGAYARGIGGIAPAWRYMDSLSFIAISNALAAYVLLKDYRPKLPWPLISCLALVLWSLACLGGLGYLASRAWSKYLPDVAADQLAQLQTTRAFMATDDPRAFASQPDNSRPVPNVDADVWLLRNPIVRAILPACVREPLHVVPASNTNDTFVRNGWLLSNADPPTETSWGSYSAKQAAAKGAFESQPVRASTLPYLEIAVAGDLGEPGLSLELVELNGGKATEIKPSFPPGGQWMNVQVAAPAGEFKVVARDDSDTGWFAFKEPREMGCWSFLTLKLLACWKYFVVLGVGGFLLNLARTRNGRSEGPPQTSRSAVNPSAHPPATSLAPRPLQRNNSTKPASSEKPLASGSSSVARLNPCCRASATR